MKKRAVIKNKLYSLPRRDVCAADREGFTLAETLITLLLIGVIAVLTIPSLMTQINEYTLGKQRDVFSKKFAEGLRLMRVDDKLSEKYATTADFINEMKKYFKISAVCKNNNLTGCFAEKFTYPSYQETISFGGKNAQGQASNAINTDKPQITFTTANLKTTTDIAKETGISAKYSSDVMGLVFSDGVQMLITVNPNCEGITSGDTNGNHTSCFQYIADVNGKKSPSSITKDIITNMQMVNLGYEIASIGFVRSTSEGGNYNSVNGDWWLGAKEYCENLTEDGGGWRLPTRSELSSFAKELFPRTLCHTVKDGPDEWEECDEQIYNTPLAQLINLSDATSTCIWSDTPYTDSAAYTCYIYSQEANPDDWQTRGSFGCVAMCVR